MSFFNCYTFPNFRFPNLNWGCFNMFNPMQAYMHSIMRLTISPPISGFNNSCPCCNQAGNLGGFNSGSIFLSAPTFLVNPTPIQNSPVCNNQLSFYAPPTLYLNPLNIKPKMETSLKSKEEKTDVKNEKVQKNVENSPNRYLCYTTTKAAAEAADNDPSLEKLNDNNWITISSHNFKTDIPYAKKGAMSIMTEVAKLLNTKLTITSALATGHPRNPHAKATDHSHHNANNPKLDLAIPAGMTDREFATKLHNTGYFANVIPERDHVDVEIDPKKFDAVNV